jgi:hypothetical protein
MFLMPLKKRQVESGHYYLTYPIEHCYFTTDHNRLAALTVMAATKPLVNLRRLCLPPNILPVFLGVDHFAPLSLQITSLKSVQTDLPAAYPRTIMEVLAGVSEDFSAKATRTLAAY